MNAKSIDNQWTCTISASPQRVLKGDSVTLTVEVDHPSLAGFNEEEKIPFYGLLTYTYSADDPRLNDQLPAPITGDNTATFHVPKLPDGDYVINVEVAYKALVAMTKKVTAAMNLPPDDLVSFPDKLSGHTAIDVVTHEMEVQAAVTMQRAGTFPTGDQALWVAIRNRTAAIDFNRFDKFIQCIFCTDDKLDFTLPANAFNRQFPAAKCLGDLSQDRPLSFQGPYAYAVLKLATQVFLTLECGVVIRDDKSGLFNQEQERIRLGDPSATLDSIKNDLFRYLQLDNPAALPYLDRIVNAIIRLDPSASKEVLPYCHGILQHRMTAPSMLELIWSYWQEEGMLVQTMNTIAYRFQNMRSSPRDPLGELEIDPLRPLNNLLWGFIQDEHNRLTVPRRAYEYDHHYGLKLVGKAVPNLVSADSRSKFIEAFHNLLYRTAVFYKEDAETTVIADAFPLLNALREVHLLLAEGAHNQFGDLPWTARSEMLMTQWLLARPEMREFLRGRHMVPYQEPWMGAVDCMKKLQGWSDTTVTHFHELAVTGERIVLSMRYGDWSDINNIEEQAKNWARYWKPDIQRYIHGYQTVTGVDLMAEVTDSRDASQRSQQPSILLQRRLAAQTGQTRIPNLTRSVGSSAGAASGFIESPMAARGRLLRNKVDE